MVPKKDLQGMFLDAIHVLPIKQYRKLKQVCKYSVSLTCCMRLGSMKCMSVSPGQKRLCGLPGLQLTGGEATC